MTNDELEGIRGRLNSGMEISHNMALAVVLDALDVRKENEALRKKINLAERIATTDIHPCGWCGAKPNEGLTCVADGDPRMLECPNRGCPGSRMSLFVRQWNGLQPFIKGALRAQERKAFMAGWRARFLKEYDEVGFTEGELLLAQDECDMWMADRIWSATVPA